MTNTESEASNARMAEALDNLEALISMYRDYLNGEGEALELLRLTSWVSSNADDLTRGLVHSARFAGYTWAEVGGALGTSRQAAHERYSAV